MTDQKPGFNPHLAGAEAMATWLLETNGELANYVPSCEVERETTEYHEWRVYPVVRRHGGIVWRGDALCVNAVEATTGDLDLQTARAFSVGAAQRYIVLRCLVPAAVLDPMWDHYIDRASGVPPDHHDTRQTALKLDGPDFELVRTPLDVTPPPHDAVQTPSGWTTDDGFECPPLIPVPQSQDDIKPADGES